MEWKTVKLGDYFDIAWGNTSITKKSYISQGYVAYSATGADGYLKEYEHDEQGIILSAIGARCGKCFLADGKWTAIKNTIVILSKSDELIDCKYAWYFLNDEKKWRPKGAGQPFITQGKALSFELPVPFKNGKPDLAEQRRIVSELDKILLLQEKSVSDVKKTDNLFSSICREWFEKKGFDSNKKKLDDECIIVKGKSPTLKTQEGEYTFVVTSEKRRSANVFQFDGEAVCIPLISSTGHGHASLHRIHYQTGKFALANIMVALVPKDRNQLVTKYLYYYLSFYKDELLVPLMRGVANVTIPLYKINDIVVDIPKINQQERLVTTLEEVEVLKLNLLNRHKLIEKCFQSTLNYAFQGKL